MTSQVDLEKIWALTGGSTDPDILLPGKYQDGWIVEIPTYQNFNWVLQTHSKNILVIAEQGKLSWQNDIAYVAGTTVLRNTVKYYCKLSHTNQDPATDTTGTYWVLGDFFGLDSPVNMLPEYGVRVKNVQPQSSPVLWQGNAMTLQNKSVLLQLHTENIAYKNWLFGNVIGELVAIDLGTDSVPDGRSISLTDPAVHRIFHEGHPPEQSEVSGTIPDAPSDGKMYARINNNWVVVTTTVVQSEPPPPVVGAGAGWFNLGDGQFYIDINDGDSSQWAPANPPMIPVVSAADVSYDNSVSGLTATNVQDAIDELAP